ncbi:5-deoxyglucuronate isomerase [Devosia riboflavina]|uniref:5-deoxyglucuronate isomerase n=1 Tax=Devosia riboflavina TaxID=46914 RepID=A0A087M431_9HYPH|nr:5-deoxy-glucuronate isomerase [Devosia riboflavina]KFL31634.1 5-deoxyglucuronate isomerase [Devosia riboflavina]
MTKSPLLVRPTAKTGRIHDVTPASAGWTHVGFGLHRLKAGEAYGEATEEREVCLVIVGGKGRFAVDGEDFGELGERMSPFKGAPWALYVPAGRNWAVDATTDLELAVCSAPGGGDFHAKIIPPGTHPRITRGKGANVRHVYNIMPEDDGSANALLVVEVITPQGNTSSYPPHKHDQDNLPHESFLEETYYHRFNPPQGFAFQRVFTDDRSLDEAMAVEDGDVTLVPRGYHPVATTAGYDLYYLNVMAGPKRVWKFHNAPEHEWMLK